MSDDPNPFYLQLSTNDLPKTKEFYQRAFGWEFVDYGPSYASFQNESGGFEAVEDDKHVPARGALIVLFAPKIEETEAAVVAAGGRISTPTYGFPGGRRFHFRDPADNELAVWSFPED